MGAWPCGLGAGFIRGVISSASVLEVTNTYGGGRLCYGFSGRCICFAAVSDA